MTNLEYVRGFVLPPAFELLPPALHVAGAGQFLLVIGCQESGFGARRQMPTGPARGFWQFEERGATAEILANPRTRDLVLALWYQLGYRDAATPHGLQTALEHNDVLAAACARLRLWASPRPLPTGEQPELGWQIYLDTWRPGRPRPNDWAESWRHGWA